MSSKNLAVPCVYALILSGADVLFQRRQNTGYQDGKLTLPSGHINQGERPRQALIRELFEEHGIIVKDEDVSPAHICYRPRHDSTGDRADYVFFVRHWKGEIRICEDKCSEVVWVNPQKPPSDVTPHNLLWVRNWMNGVWYSELGVDFFKKHGLYTPPKEKVAAAV